jgi:hypothetical protein
MGEIFKVWDTYVSPAVDEGMDLGSSALRFKDLYLSGNITSNGDITLTDTLGITFGVTRPVILKANSSAGAGVCRLEILGGTDEDIELYFKGTSNTGSITFMEDEDYFTIPDFLVTSGSYLYFRDLQISITSATDGHLDLTADTSIDLNGNVALGSASTSTLNCTGRLIVRTLATDPQDATPANRPAGSVAEIGYYTGKMYFCTNTATPTWELITSG